MVWWQLLCPHRHQPLGPRVPCDLGGGGGWEGIPWQMEAKALSVALTAPSPSRSSLASPHVWDKGLGRLPHGFPPPCPCVGQRDGADRTPTCGMQACGNCLWVPPCICDKGMGRCSPHGGPAGWGVDFPS